MLSHKFKPCHNRIVLSLQCIKLKRKSHESAQEWADRLQKKSAEYDYNEHDRKITEKFSHGLHNKGMINEILREGSVVEDINDTPSEWVLLWAQRVEAQSAGGILQHKRGQWLCIKQTKYARQDSEICRKQKWVENCKYCRLEHPHDSVPPTAKLVGDMKRPTTSW